MLGWLQALMPKEDRFFDHFARHAAILVQGGEALQGLLRGGDSVPDFCRAIVERETAADAVTRDVLLAVRRSFITPFDRGLIQSLITSMDDAIDEMNKTAKVITLFEVRSFEPEMRAIGDIILQAAHLTAKGVPLLSRIGKQAAELNAITEEITVIEERADHLYDQGRKALYQASLRNDPMVFVVGNEIYNHLEKVVDRFEDVANEISAIVIEHA